MYKTIKSILVLLTLINLSFAVLGQKIKTHPDDKLYEKMTSVRGKVEILNDPSLGRTAASNARILFQKIGCANCLILIMSDLDGDYALALGKGKYRVIMREVRGGLEPSYDLLAPSQARVIDVPKGGGTIKFNIQMMLPPN